MSSANGASSSDTATFNYGVYSVAPTTTTTSTTTTTTLAPTTTSVSASPVTTAAAPTTSVLGVTTTVATVIRNSTGSGGATATTVAAQQSTSTTSTVMPTTTTTTIPAPDAPAASPGEAGATVDGEEVDATVTRADNSLVVAAGGINATIYGTTADGQRIALNTDGNLVLENGDFVVVAADGYRAGTEVEVWLRSTPKMLGTVTVDASGAVKGTFEVPASVEAGDHRVLLSGTTKSGGDSVLGVGLRIGSYGKESNTSKWIISLAIALAVGLGLLIPTTTRRRRKSAATH